MSSRPYRRVFIDLTDDDPAGSHEPRIDSIHNQSRTHHTAASIRAISRSTAVSSTTPSTTHRVSSAATVASQGIINNGVAMSRAAASLKQGDMSKDGVPVSQSDGIENADPRNYKRSHNQPNLGFKRQKISHKGGSHGRMIDYQPPMQQDRSNIQLPPPLSMLESRIESTRVLSNDAARANDRSGRLSQQGAIQKPRAIRKPCDVRVSEVLRKQLIPHVLKAVSPYREELKKSDRLEMGSKIAKDLVSVKGFMEDLGSRDFLSIDFEQNLALKAVGRAAVYFKKLEDKGRTVARPPVPAFLSEKCDATWSPRVNSEASTVSEELFDPQQHNNQSHRSGVGLQTRGRSYSPATSLSNDAIDASSLQDDSENAAEAEAERRQLPKRTSRAAQPIYARPRRTRAKRKPYLHHEEGQNVRQEPDTANHAPAEIVQTCKSPTQIGPGFRNREIAQSNPSYPGSATIVPKISDPIAKLLRERELYGMTPVRARAGQSSFKAVSCSYLEDCFVRQSEWTDCSGTILTLTWTSPDAFVCGAVAHSDANHMQYNKPGNLSLGSILHDSLRAYSDHRVVRPIVSITQNASNALEAMRHTQDPWMYAPVVTTAHSESSGFTFSASYDKTVKVWSTMGDGSSMTLQGTWIHEERVNFVAASQLHDRVATASESKSNAVRVYNLDRGAIGESSYDQYCGNRASEQAEEIGTQEWAYYPSTIQWGRAERVRYLLLVGWSPRSDTGDDNDIPEEKRNTGELCLWNSLDSSRVPINSAHLQNVFEVIWHPTQPFFLAATSPSGIFDVDTTKTQIRLFGLNANGGFINNKTFDCPAWDINELTIMPTSQEDCFVTVSCTDTCTYVYDSKRGDQPIHVLQHGESLDEPENEDSGVKFAAWGRSNDRFYTGSSDGQLKVWDIKAPPGKAFIRTILKLSGGIYAGSFSKDFSKLIIGDDTGKVHLLAVDDSDLDGNKVQQVPAIGQLARSSSGILPNSIKRPKLIIPHPEPPHPDTPTVEVVEQTSIEIAHQFLDEGHLQLLPNLEFPTAPKAIYQGPNYNETLLYRYEAHEDEDAMRPLLPEYLSKQQFYVHQEEQQQKEARRREDRERRLQQALRPPPSRYQCERAHRLNLDLDFSFEKLSLNTRAQLKKERVEVEGDFIFDYEIMPSKKHAFLGGS